MNDRLISIDDTRNGYLGGICKVGLYKLINQGELTRVHVGARAFITESSIQCYIRRLAEASA